MEKAKTYWAKIKNYWYYATRMTVMYYRANKKATIGMAAGILVTAITPIGFSYLIKEVVDQVVKVVDEGALTQPAYLWKIVIAYFALKLVNRISWRLVDYCERTTYLDFGKFITVKVNEKLSLLDFEDWENPALNNLINKVSETYSWRPVNFASRQLWMVQNLVSIVSNSLLIIGLGPVYFLLVFFSTIPELFVGLKFSRSVWNIHGAKASIRRDFWNTSHYLGDDRDLKEIHIFGVRERLLQRLESLYQRFFGYQKEAIKKMTQNRIWATLFALLIDIFVIGSIFFKAIAGKITVGSLTFYISLIENLTENFKGFFRNLAQSFEDLLYITDLFKVLGLEQKINPNPEGIKVKPPFKIEFKNVSFKYPQSKKYVIEDFNLTINPQEKIAIVGENGAGKTTLVKLLIRFYDLTTGKVLINGKNLKDLDLIAWRKQIGVLFQDFNRYAYTVTENIRLGDVEKPAEKDLLLKVTKRSGAQEFINDLPKKFQTILSKQFSGGTELSTGQWQKMALSRAFFRDAPLLILDEPTSAIDAKAEYEIFNEIDRLEKGKTVIMVSHRFSTVRNADKIYVVDKGRITESGTHQQLLTRQGQYAKLFELQAKGYQE